MYYLGERVYKWELGLDLRRVPHDVLYYILSIQSIQLEQGIATAWRGSAAIDHLATFVHALGPYPPPIEFDPFVDVEELDRGQGDAPTQQHDKRMRRDSDFEALNTAIVVEKPEHGQGASLSFIFDHTRQPTQGMMETHLLPSPILQVSIFDYNEVSSVRSRAPLVSSVTNVYECMQRVNMAPPAARGRDRCQPVIIEETKESSSVNTQILRLKKPVFQDCQQSGQAGGHSKSSPKLCQYGT
ncbi:hypothetical protein JCGZ_19982 [Jatropha curcas]|uniref:Uncharacterized protein n=1 Tax=Jatropha curcas TaxID=180498 RepID=A0A067JY88_JATCU|nr:hypothetical protein JCGZ_19982 [Jatropha curcas]